MVLEQGRLWTIGRVDGALTRNRCSRGSQAQAKVMKNVNNKIHGGFLCEASRFRLIRQRGGQ